MSRMGLRAYARHRGCALSAVQKAIATSRISKGDDGLIDSAAADAAWVARTDPAKQRKEPPAAPPAPPDPPLLTGEVLPAPGVLTRRPQFFGPDWPEPSVAPPNPESRPPAAVGDNVVPGAEFLEWKTRLARAQALREEAKQLEEQRALIRADEARQTFTAIGRMFRQERENLPAAAASKLIGLTDVREIERRLRAMLRDADKRVADQIEKQYADVVGNHGERSGTGQ